MRHETIEQQQAIVQSKDAELQAKELKIQALTLELAPPPVRPKRSRAGHQPLPAHLPRIAHRHEPESCQCGQCGRDLVKIREDVTEQLDVEPAQFFVHRHVRPQYACCYRRRNGRRRLTELGTDQQQLDLLPLYRLEQITARQQVALSRSTLAECIENR